MSAIPNANNEYDAYGHYLRRLFEKHENRQLGIVGPENTNPNSVKEYEKSFSDSPYSNAYQQTPIDASTKTDIKLNRHVQLHMTHSNFI